MAAIARIKSQLFGFFTRLKVVGVSVSVGVGARSWVAVGEMLGVKVGLGKGVSVGGRGVKVAVAGGVTRGSGLPCFHILFLPVM